MNIFSSGEIATIVTAISRHSDKNTVHEPMDEVLKDADVMHHCLYDTTVPVVEKERAGFAGILVELGCNATGA